jgi:hypothetical protein
VADGEDHLAVEHADAAVQPSQSLTALRTIVSNTG